MRPGSQPARPGRAPQPRSLHGVGAAQRWPSQPRQFATTLQPPRPGWGRSRDEQPATAPSVINSPSRAGARPWRCGPRKTVIVARPLGPESRRAGLARATASQVAHARPCCWRWPRQRSRPEKARSAAVQLKAKRGSEATSSARAWPSKPRQPPQGLHLPKAPRASPTREL
jgi:hypothetical protein